ncbi:MAG: ABC-2 family transporter protein [Firmicutes bacterium]|nr:ABC-2 family transporter protein [Candidatus Fermentithermobacillaceae bacterium]
MRLYFAALSLSIKRLLAYRGSLWIYVAVQALTFLTIPFMYAGLLSSSGSIGDLPSGYVLLLTGVAESITLLYDFLVGNGVEEFASGVASGELDYWLVYPLRSQFSQLLLRPGTLSLFCIPIPIWLICSARIPIRTLGPFSFWLLLAAGVLALLARTAYGLLYAALSVRLARVYSLDHLVKSLFSYSAFPCNIYNGAAKIFVTVIIPVALVANVPASILVSGKMPREFLVLLAVCVPLVTIGVVAFSRATRAYVSGGG